MSKIFKQYIGKTVYDEAAKPYILTEIIGWGSQGVVFKEESGVYAVKILFNKQSVRNELIRRLTWLKNIELNRETRVIKPEAILAKPTGYIMRFVKGHQPLTNIIYYEESNDNSSFRSWYNIQTGGLKKRLLLGALIARAFDSLHHDGLSYCDLSDTNILVAIRPRECSICLIDPDNLSITNRAESLVLGTPRYMAPEVIKGHSQPDSVTDNYSLAVILFNMLRLGHPFIGDSIHNGDPQLEELAMRGEKPYVDHPEDDTNRSSTLLPKEVVFTNKLLQLFQRVFINGVNNRMERPTAVDWAEACLQALQKVTVCNSCLATFYPYPYPFSCPWCGNYENSIARLSFYNLMYDQKKISEHFLDRISDYDIILSRQFPSEITARFAIPSSYGVEGDRSVATIKCINNERYEIKNNQEFDIIIKTPEDNNKVRLGSGRSYQLTIGSVIYFFNSYKKESQRFIRVAKLMNN